MKLLLKSGIASGSPPAGRTSRDDARSRDGPQLRSQPRHGRGLRLPRAALHHEPQQRVRVSPSSHLCSASSVVMHPRLRCRGSQQPLSWSSCSMEQFDEVFAQGIDFCLHDLPAQIYEGPICGNALLEDGEECDCGTIQVEHHIFKKSSTITFLFMLYTLYVGV